MDRIGLEGSNSGRKKVAFWGGDIVVVEGRTNGNLESAREHPKDGSLEQ
jgi:hypothetical protein